MVKVALLVVTLLWQGHWFGGEAGTITFKWTDADKVPDAVVTWEVLYEKASLGKGRLVLKAVDKGGTLSLTLPEVRVKTEARFVYKVMSSDGKEDLGGGERAIVLYPKAPLAPWVETLGTKSLVVWDEDGGLPVVLKSAGMPHTQIKGGGGLQMVSADIILVGEDRIDASVFSQAELLEQAKAGSSVVVFSQKAPARLMESSVIQKHLAEKLEWRYEHQLLGQLSKGDVGSMLVDRKEQVLGAIRLDAGGPGVAVAYWPGDNGSERASEVDALIAVKPLGKGRVIYWQLPLGGWAGDPRSQMVLAGALDFLLKPVQAKVRTEKEAKP